MAKKMVLVLLLAIAFMTKSAEAQLPDCYFQEVNLVPCLTVGTTGNTSEVCCRALNQALSIGQKCACSIMFSTNLFLDLRNPIPTSPHGIELPGCNLFMPSLSACQDVLPLTMTPPPAIDTNSTVATIPSPMASVLVPNSTLDNQVVPMREGQEPMDLTSRSGFIDQTGASSSEQIQIINHALCIACILIVISGQAFLSLI
ncbi:hypothetical protein FCM35_KLT12856 [Carex littledalei]|uniref:Bifunctional inhibitor/plant lipid transfer protein/seed storage helical domain-containing protein n=1 Tax=Carex littledalei TaxID=544730 RepID=A0A833QJK0_9POAL|nr:hypothetical protein FCM35_KLT12856 [Carex littledalei]